MRPNPESEQIPHTTVKNRNASSVTRFDGGDIKMYRMWFVKVLAPAQLFIYLSNEKLVVVCKFAKKYFVIMNEIKVFMIQLYFYLHFVQALLIATCLTHIFPMFSLTWSLLVF